MAKVLQLDSRDNVVIALPTCANARRKTQIHRRQNSFGKKNDRSGRDRRNGSISSFRPAAHFTAQDSFVDGGYLHLDRALT